MRNKNMQWNGYEGSWPSAHMAVFMDLRDELQTLVSLFRGIPCAVGLLKKIERQLRMGRRCPKHPRYTATRKPRVACAGCHRYYRAVWK